MLRIRLITAVIGLLGPLLGTAAELPPDQTGLYPDDVVALQMSALQDNDAQDSGIALVWEYTSPANQRANGPYPRFARMIHESFGDLLHSRNFDVGAAKLEDGGASVPVRLVCAAGNTHGFIFWLTMEHPGDRDGHWLTEGVTPVPLPQDAPGAPTADTRPVPPSAI